LLFQSLTVRQNLTLAARRSRSDVDSVFEYLPALKPLSSATPGCSLAAKQQMLAIGRALLTKPSLLMIDELSMGLAPVIVDRLLAVVRSAANELDLSVLLVEQHVRLALGIADSAYVISHGRLTTHGSADDVTSRSTRSRPATSATGDDRGSRHPIMMIPNGSVLRRSRPPSRRARRRARSWPVSPAEGRGGALDPGDRGQLVVVGRVTGHPDAADDRAGLVLDQHAAGDRDQLAAIAAARGVDEVGLLLRPGHQEREPIPSAERSVRLAEGDLESGCWTTRPPFDAEHMTAGVEHDHGQRLQPRSFPAARTPAVNGLGGLQADVHVSPFNRAGPAGSLAQQLGQHRPDAKRFVRVGLH